MERQEMGVTVPFRGLAPFGVEIERDLSRPLAPSEAFHLTQLLRAHGLILARGQSLSMARQREICALFGPILDRAGETGTMSNDGGGPSASELTWHSDAAYTEAPFDALALHALDVVDDASSTRFVSAEQALAALPPDLADALAGREQEMISPHYTRLAERTCDRRDPEAQKRGIRPAIVTNPHNGRRCVWVSELQTARLLGMDWEESRAVLHVVFDVLYDAAGVFEHRWRKGDLLIWDNIALQHARGDLAGVGRRVLQRVIVGTQGVAPHITPWNIERP
ncbi:TauD/TfdA dioxygenase family protein [Novosphingobium album (ex Liu et al. 2023)]|uniref:TauD/TfdA family dioxygenase n=1 Tax=Novosphingobium album (ex Liu et al. 2023) TaxID=3031130 RepID=A0ABT5WLX0_9SPHN|nr:TauD/TfdA family dioxygenase [Novosphingobium album (ex Liu et al. 2023)]MDE8651039.1 TauD/TfdA family dioxygenase [Novosphingobium album (ex Liu et al. 2023)]